MVNRDEKVTRVWVQYLDPFTRGSGPQGTQHIQMKFRWGFRSMVSNLGPEGPVERKKTDKLHCDSAKSPHFDEEHS